MRVALIVKVLSNEDDNEVSGTTTTSGSSYMRAASVSFITFEVEEVERAVEDCNNSSLAA